MLFIARFFDSNPSDKSLLNHTYTWEMEAPDHAPGRVMVSKAMRAAGWPASPYNHNYRRRGENLTVEIDMPEKPYQIITLMIKDPQNWYPMESFRYVKPAAPALAQAASSRLAMLGIWLVCLFAPLIIIPRQLYFVIFHPDRAKGLAVAIDRAANGALNGNPNETISSRANRARANGRRWGCVLCRVLDWFKREHCRDSAGK